MFTDKIFSNRGGGRKGKKFLFLVKLLNWGAVFSFCTVPVFSQDQPIAAPSQPAIKLSSAEFIGQDGLTIDRLIETGGSRRADLLAARQRLDKRKSKIKNNKKKKKTKGK